MNGIIHVCSHPEDDNPHFRITEEKIFADIFHYIEVRLLIFAYICCIFKYAESTCTTVWSIHCTVKHMQGGLGGYTPAKPGKVRAFDTGQGKVREIRKSQGSCGLPVLWYLSCNSHKINITRVLLSKVDMQKMDCK